MENSIKKNILFNEFDTLVTPRSSSELVSLANDTALSALGRFTEALVISDTVIIPLRGPALEIVALLRWLGSKGFARLIEEGVIQFVFCPGTIAYISQRNKLALGLKAGPGLEHFIGVGKDWENVERAVETALREQLELSQDDIRIWSGRIAKATSTLPHREIYDAAIKAAYQDALFLLADKHGIIREAQWKILDNETDKNKVHDLIELSSANRDLLCAQMSNCDFVYGNERTWTALETRLRESKEITKAKETLIKLLQFERLPDIPEITKRGFPVSNIIQMRSDPRCADFRSWLYNLPQSSSDIEIIRAYTELYKEKLNDAFPVKAIRIGLAMVGLLKPPWSFISTAVSVADTLWSKKLLSKWNPRVFINRHFRYKQE